MAGSVLIVDDDPVQRRLLDAAVQRFGYTSLAADGGAAALKMLRGPDGHDIGVVVLDLLMPEMDGLAVLEAMREGGIERPVIVQTSQGAIETVVKAMRNGAFDFVVKPVAPERLRTAITNAFKLEAMETRARRDRRGGALGLKDIATKSPEMERVLRLAQKAAATNIPVMIEGESGTGKEILARAIQAAGERRSKPFVTVNCGAIPENLVESILFGHEKGAFTGATDRHVGKFVEADGGTLFLDEIGDLPLAVQVKLLRAVQDGVVDPVGGRVPVKVDIRLISATHRNLLKQVEEGSFREDLFYRLNVYPIMVPPLRNRRVDIPQLVRHFMARSWKHGAPGVNAIAPEALAMLALYDWPGNIRQLENAIFRACVLCESDILAEHDFPQIRAQVDGSVSIERMPATPHRQDFAEMAEPAAAASAKSFGLVRALDERGNVRALDQVEADMIRLALDHYQGQMSEVARRLGIGRSTLYRKLKEYGIDSGEEVDAHASN